MTTTNNYRVKDKNNIFMHGKRTKFSLYKRQGDSFVFIGHFTAPGHYKNDRECISSAIENINTHKG